MKTTDAVKMPEQWKAHECWEKVFLAAIAGGNDVKQSEAMADRAVEMMLTKGNFGAIFP